MCRISRDSFNGCEKSTITIFPSVPSWAQIPQKQKGANLADCGSDDGEDVAGHNVPNSPKPAKKEEEGAHSQGKMFSVVTKKWKSRGCCAARMAITSGFCISVTFHHSLNLVI